MVDLQCGRVPDVPYIFKVKCEDYTVAQFEIWLLFLPALSSKHGTPDCDGVCEWRGSTSACLSVRASTAPLRCNLHDPSIANVRCVRGCFD